MIFYQLNAGGDRNFAYLAADADGGKAALFDPPVDASVYLPLLEKHNLNVLYIVATHGHADHTMGLESAKKATGGDVIVHENSAVSADQTVTDESTLPLGALSMRFIHTPGHTEDSICILVGDKLVTGDTLFVGKVGGTGFGEDARNEWDSFQNKLLLLDDNIEVYPGHDYGVKPTSTIGIEKKTNPFLLRETFDDFVDLKRNWLQYKKEHGIS